MVSNENRKKIKANLDMINALVVKIISIAETNKKIKRAPKGSLYFNLLPV